jgi:hypothetical protein
MKDLYASREHRKQMWDDSECLIYLLPKQVWAHLGIYPLSHLLSPLRINSGWEHLGNYVEMLPEIHGKKFMPKYLS